MPIGGKSSTTAQRSVPEAMMSSSLSACAAVARTTAAAIPPSVSPSFIFLSHVELCFGDS
jgi:hypothetical protein